MESPALLTKSHPSFGHSFVAFLFKEGEKLILVEAKNSWAVQVIERILLQDKAVSPTCHVLLVFRDSENIGIRSESVQEVKYVDFMIDHVEPSRIMTDAAMAYSFRCSLSDVECKRAAERLAQDLEGNRTQEFDMETEGPNPSPSSSVENKLVRLEGGLVGLGFKKSQISTWVKNSKSKVESAPVEELIRIAISDLTSAA